MTDTTGAEILDEQTIIKRVDHFERRETQLTGFKYQIPTMTFNVSVFLRLIGSKTNLKAVFVLDVVKRVEAKPFVAERF